MLKRSVHTALRNRLGASATYDGAALGQARLTALREKLHVDVLRPLPPRGEAPAPARVVVIGAGFAGLASAYFLRMLGFDVVVVEAAQRVGGRVWSVQGPGGPGRLVEAGAELIGWNHAVWLGLAEVFSLNFSTMTGGEMVAQLGLTEPMWLDGQPVDDPDEVWEWMEAALSTLDVASRVVAHPYEPWNTPGAAALDARSVASWRQSLALPPLVDCAVETILACDSTLPTAEQSYLALLAQVSGGGGSAYWSDTEVMRCSSGNQSLATEMAAALQRSGVEMHTGTAVAAVELAQPAVTVTLVGGRTIPADFAVLAVPPTAWRRIRFEPALGNDVLMSTGPAVKFLSAVDTRFWLESRRAPTALSDVIGETWEATDNQAWSPGQHAVLSVFAGAGQAARALEHRDAIAEWYAPQLEQLFPGYTAHRRDTQFLAWPDDPLIGCGYSSPRPGFVTTVARSLSRPSVPFQQRLVFAGEHTSPPFFGYMEGALESGLVAMGHIAEMTSLFPPGNVTAALDAAATAGRAPF